MQSLKLTPAPPRNGHSPLPRWCSVPACTSDAETAILFRFDRSNTYGLCSAHAQYVRRILAELLKGTSGD